MRLIDADELAKVKFHPLPYTHITPPDLIKSQTEAYERGWNDAIDAIVESAETAEPRWIPVKTRPMTEEERWNFEEHTGIQLDDEDAVFFDCKMPEDGQRIWISTIHGNVFEDFCENDGDFLGLEGNGDWLDVTAWMPMFVPEPWKGESDGVDS